MQKYIYILIILIINVNFIFAQRPYWPKYIDNTDIKNRHLNKKLRLHLTGKDCDSGFNSNNVENMDSLVDIGQPVFICLEDSILLRIKGKTNYFKLIINQTIEGRDYHSMHMISNDSINKRIIRIFDSKLRQIMNDSIQVQIWIDVFHADTGKKIEDECYNQLLWIERKKLKGIYRPK